VNDLVEVPFPYEQTSNPERLAGITNSLTEEVQLQRLHNRHAVDIRAELNAFLDAYTPGSMAE
jgi:hypothetical protein